MELQVVADYPYGVAGTPEFCSGVEVKYHAG